MTDENLRDLLTRVHQRLSTTGSIDPEAREMLATVMRDIDGALGQGPLKPSSPLPAERNAAAKSTLPRLEALAVQFEADHPALSQLLRQVGALLGQAGI